MNMAMVTAMWGVGVSYDNYLRLDDESDVLTLMSNNHRIWIIIETI